MPPKNQPKAYYTSLTGLRAIAAFLVFFHHFNPFADSGSFSWHLADQGFIGVSIFYVLSGLLICLRYYDQIELSREWGLNYWRNRIARIYPVYFLVTVVTILLMEYAPALQVGVDPGQWHTYTTGQKTIVAGLNLTMLKGFSESFKFTGVAQGWSLTVEETFYLAAPILFLALHRSKRLFAAVAAGMLGVGLLLTAYFSRHYFYGFFGSYDFLFNYTFFGRIVEFLMGIGLGLYIQQRASVVEKQGGFAFTMLGLTWIVLVMACSAFFKIPFQSATGILLNNLVLPVGVCFLLLGLMTERSLIDWVLSTKLFENLGKASYAFYLIHMGFASAIMTHVFHLPLLVQFVLLNLLALAIYRFIESPFHKIVRAKKPNALTTGVHLVAPSAK